MPNPNNIPSKQLVIQTAARALRRIHLDYQPFGLGFRGTEPSDYQRLNHSAGAETAHEVAVAAAFVHEFHSSKVAHGWLSRRGRRRHFLVEHEFGYSVGDATKRIDAVIWRVDQAGACGEWGILPIEMKRAQRFMKHLATGQPRGGASTKNEVKEDIEKLIDFSDEWHEGKHRRGSVKRHPPDAPVFPHVLVWGVSGSGAFEAAQNEAELFLEDAFDRAECDYHPSKTVFEFLPLSFRAEDVRLMWVGFSPIPI